MARYKVLKSVAHSIGHSFASTLNYSHNDYVMGHLLRQAREVRESSLLVDLMEGTAAPAILVTPPVANSVDKYSAWLPDLVRRHFSDMAYVAAARMTVAFDLSVERPNRYAPECIESPYLIRVEIDDNRGKTWVVELRDWWFPEPPYSKSWPVRRPSLLQRAKAWYQRLRFGSPYSSLRTAA